MKFFIKTCFFIFIFCLLISFPSRLIFYYNSISFSGLLDYFLLGMFSDVDYLLHFVGFGFFISFILLFIFRKKTVALFFTWPLLHLMVCALGLFLGISQTYLFERGRFPTPHEIIAAFHSSEFVSSVISSLSGVYVFFMLGFFIVSLILSWFFLRFYLVYSKVVFLKVLLAFLLVKGFVSGFSSVFYKISDGFDREIVSTPIRVLTRSLLKTREVDSEIRGIYQTQEIDAGLFESGMQKVGLKAENVTLETCSSSPYRQDISSKSDKLDLENKLQDFSKQLFSENKKLYIWHVLLEGFRAHEIHAFNPAAPLSLAPFLSKLTTNEYGVSLISKRMFQSANQTSSGIFSSMCGIGFNYKDLVLTDYFASLPIRCLPDVLFDSGFSNIFYYGAESEFQNRRGFMEFHKFAIHDQSIIGNRAKGAWGLSDRSSLAYVIEDATKRDEDFYYSVILSISNHYPYSKPEDYPEFLDIGLSSIFNDYVLNEDSKDIFTTIRYSDYALQEFYETLAEKKILKNSLFVIHADHGRSDMGYFGDESFTHSSARIPFVFHVPKQFLSAHSIQEEFLHRTKDLNLELNSYVMSINDIPQLLLKIFANHPKLLSLRGQHSWHSMGSMFWQQNKVYGVNGALQLFSFGASEFNSFSLLKGGSSVYSAGAVYFLAQLDKNLGMMCQGLSRK